MASIRCDAFRHRTAAKPTYLFANAGVMRGHLDRIGWDDVVANAATPRFVVRDIDRKGYSFVRHARRN
jgi:hypothetical protein